MKEQTLIAPLNQASFREYAIRAVIDWCEGEGYTPYALIRVDDNCVVPHEFVNADETIVLCVSSEATNGFELDADGMRFKARFGETIHTIDIPLERIAIIYPKEDTTQASFFPVLPSKRESENKEEKFITPKFTKL